MSDPHSLCPDSSSSESERKQQRLPRSGAESVHLLSILRIHRTPGLALPVCSYEDLTLYVVDGQTGLAEDLRVHLIN